MPIWELIVMLCCCENAPRELGSWKMLAVPSLGLEFVSQDTCIKRAVLVGSGNPTLGEAERHDSPWLAKQPTSQLGIF